MGINVVLGPPCAGKSAYVDAHKADGDVSVDFDRLAKAFGSTVAHGSTGAPRVVALSARQAAINRILRGVDADAWIIHTNPPADTLQEYVNAGAEFVMVDPGADECHARAVRDGRPESTHEAIDAWYASPISIPSPSKANKRMGGMRSDMKDMADEVVHMVREYVGREVSDLNARMVMLEAQLKAIPAGERGPQGEPGADGKDGAPGEQGAKGDPGESGQHGDESRKGPASVPEALRVAKPRPDRRYCQLAAAAHGSFCNPAPLTPAGTRPGTRTQE